MRVILFKILFFTISWMAIATHATSPYQWAVIGAGPAGVIAIGILLEQKIPAHQIIWFDPEFNVGRVGKYYQQVPANSRAQEIVALIKNSPIFAPCQKASIAELNAYPPYAEFYLGMIARPFYDLTRYVWEQGVHHLQETVTDITLQTDIWSLTTDCGTYTAEKVILAIGAEPRSLNLPGISLIPLDEALDKERLATYVTDQDTVAVFGSGASAMLLLKYLTELPVKNIINFYKHHHTQARKRSLIRGATAHWIKEVLEKSPPSHLTRVLNTPENREQYLPQCTKAIYAIGYRRPSLPAIHGPFELECPNKTGILGYHLYGFGFAFPEELQYQSHQGPVTVPLVGLTSFTKFGKRVVPQWIAE